MRPFIGYSFFTLFLAIGTPAHSESLDPAGNKIPVAIERSHCIPLVVWCDGIVTVDWPCVQRVAARWNPGLKPETKENDYYSWLYAIKQVHDGKALPAAPVEQVQ